MCVRLFLQAERHADICTEKETLVFFMMHTVAPTSKENSQLQKNPSKTPTFMPISLQNVCVEIKNSTHPHAVLALV